MLALRMIRVPTRSGDSIIQPSQRRPAKSEGEGGPGRILAEAASGREGARGDDQG